MSTPAVQEQPRIAVKLARAVNIEFTSPSQPPALRLASPPAAPPPAPLQEVLQELRRRNRDIFTIGEWFILGNSSWMVRGRGRGRRGAGKAWAGAGRGGRAHF